MMGDMHTELVDKVSDGVERIAIVWQISLKNKETEEEDGIVQGFILVPNEEVIPDRFVRLKAIGAIPEWYQDSHVQILKSKDRKLWSKSMTELEYTEVEVPNVAAE